MEKLFTQSHTVRAGCGARVPEVLCRKVRGELRSNRNCRLFTLMYGRGFGFRLVVPHGSRLTGTQNEKDGVCVNGLRAPGVVISEPTID